MEKNQLKDKISPEIITLMYHSVTSVDTNPWGICVSPVNFEKQIRFLTSNYHVIKTYDLTDQLSCGKIEMNAVCITFDDGYVNNFHYAKPILEKYNCPATFFIATSFIGQPNFWWDELEIIFLHLKNLPGQLTLTISGEVLKFTISECLLSEQQWEQHKRWRWYKEPPTSRCAIYLSIWETLHGLHGKSISAIMSIIKNWPEYNTQRGISRQPMDGQQLMEMKKNKLFTIAMHTHTHCDLSQQDHLIQLNEIKRCKRTLKEIFDVESTCLSYPFGKYNEDILKLAYDLQLDACFTTDEKAVTAKSNKNSLGRYQSCNWDETTLEKKIYKWFSYPEALV